MRTAAAVLLSVGATWGLQRPVAANEPAPAAGDAAPLPVNRIGTPDSVEVTPAEVRLTGPWESAQLLVEGRYPASPESNGPVVKDLLRSTAWTARPEGIVRIDVSGRVWPVAEGSAELTGTVAGKSVRVRAVVTGLAKADPVSFQRDIIPVLNRGGCNSGACHGTPTGKGGFHLSLRGDDPAYDHLRLTRDGGARRCDVTAPDDSLLVTKPLGAVPHMGGVRWERGGLEDRVLRRWIAEGAAYDDISRARLADLVITPSGRELIHPDVVRQMRVVARYTDGTTRDVTSLSVFSISNEQVASVDQTGLVVGKARGEVAVLARYIDKVAGVRLTILRTPEGYQWPSPPPPENNYVDKLLFAKMKRLHIPPSGLSDDAEFLRRAHLDAAGRLPSADETRAFLADKSPDKRAKVIDRLLASPEFADFWALKWSDLLRVSEENVGKEGVKIYHGWLREFFKTDRPMGDLVTALMEAQGSSYTNPPANYWVAHKDPETAAEATAQVFLGIRMQCARCHNHPSEMWSQNDYYHLASFFSGVKRVKTNSKEKVARRDTPETTISVNPSARMSQPRTGESMAARPPAADEAAPAGKDPRGFLAAWMVRRDNRFFARTMVNRVWFHILGRGIVDPPDDFRASNPPADDALLDALAADFLDHGQSLRHIVRVIMNSRVYQLTARNLPANADDGIYFSHALPRLIQAEVLMDAVCDITGLPEVFPGSKEPVRAVQLPNAGGVVPFMASFNRPARRISCECERQRDPNLTQALQFISGRMVHGKLSSPKSRLTEWLGKGWPPEKLVEEMFLSVLNRPPGAAETKAFAATLAEAGPDTAARREALEDAVWSLLNSKEFLFRR